jgi:hypothetical protein
MQWHDDDGGLGSDPLFGGELIVIPQCAKSGCPSLPLAETTKRRSTIGLGEESKAICSMEAADPFFHDARRISR